MEGFFFFKKLLIILGFSIPVIYIFNKIKVPSIIGFLITGIIIGPFGLRLIDDTAGIQFMAEIGVAFLLFTIGIEIQLSRFLKNLSEIILTGGLQILCTFLVGVAVGLAMQLSVGQSIFIGFILTHSSSALILKILKDRSDESSPQGKISIGVILFQDMMVVPMMLLIPFLAGGSGPDILMIIWKLIKSILIIVVLLAVARYLIPLVLENLVTMNMRDVLVITSVVIAMGIAWITESLGLSLAIGAFLAGLALSDTDFSHQIISDINPFRDVFLSVFFVSLGMIFNLDFLRENTGYILLASRDYYWNQGRHSFQPGFAAEIPPAYRAALRRHAGADRGIFLRFSFPGAARKDHFRFYLSGIYRGIRLDFYSDAAACLSYILFAGQEKYLRRHS